jgi:prohibitin 2
MDTKVISRLASVLIGFLAMVCVVDSCTTIQPGEVGVVFNRVTGGLSAAQPGYAFVTPFVTSIRQYPVSLRTYSMVLRQLEGSSTTDDSIDLPTKEGQHIKQDISVTYNTSSDKAAQVFRSFNGADIESIESTFIRRTIITAAQNQSGQMSLTEVISSGRDKLQVSITSTLEKELSKMGFNLDKVNLGAAHLPAAIEQQMQQKMAVQQTALQAEFELQKQQSLAKAKVAQAEGSAQAILVQAQAQAKANAALSQSLTNNLIEYRKLEKWDGQLPQVTGGSSFVDLRTKPN